MSNKSMRLITVVVALLLSACVAVDANAQCCGQQAMVFYAPTQTAFTPVACQSCNTGWYPGYWMNRIGTRLWGSPSTQVVAYQPTFASGCSSCASSWLPSSCSTCSSGSPCSTCSSCTAGYAPCNTCNTCTTAYAPACSTCQTGCSTCSAAPVVTQASYQTYQQPAGCSTCGASAPATAPPTYVQPAAPLQPTPAPTATEPAPSLGPAGPQSNTSSKPADTATPPSPDVQPAPSGDTQGVDPYHPDKGDSSTYFEAPKLFNPKDRTAKHTGVATVRTAVYEQPVTYRKTSTTTRGPVTAAQAQQDAIGWSSALK